MTGRKIPVLMASAFLLLMAAVAGADTDTENVTGTVTVPQTCGLNVSSATAAFGSLNTGATSAADVTVVVSNEGSVAAAVTINGTQWSDGGTNTMPVGQTHWSITAAQAYGDMTALTGVATSIFPALGNGSGATAYFKLRIPLGQAAAQYNQTITFTSNC